MKKIDRTFDIAREDLGLSRREALRRAAGAGALFSLFSLGLGIPTSAEAAEGETFGRFPKHPRWKFTFVNHVTTNPFLSRPGTAQRMPVRSWAVLISGLGRRSRSPLTWLTP